MPVQLNETAGRIVEDKLPLHRKITYSFTDMAGNLLYCIISSYLLFFFTDVFGLTVGVAGTLLLIARFFDALDAPIWGIIIDHTHSKYGQSRPWFLWMALPFAVFVWLLFTTPDISGTTKIVWAGVMYILAGISYTGMSTPITSVLPNLTSNTEERTVANSFRMVGGNIGNFFAITFIIPLATFLGGGNDQKGWSLAVLLYAIIAVVLLVIAFADMREKNIERVKSIPIRQSFKAAKRNWPWVLIVSANVIYWVGFMARNSTLAYYFQYNMNDTNLISIFNGFTIIQIVGMASIPFIVKVFRKWGTTVFGLILAILGQFLMAVVGDNITAMLVGWCLACVGSGVACSMFFNMVGDTVDYGEWKNGIRASGFLTAIGSSFCIKLGAGFGSFIPSLIMNAFNYVPNHTQTVSALSAIKFSFMWLPIIIFVINIIPMVLYKKYEDHEPVVIRDLLARKEQTES
ncbi:MFS transporter [Sporolactobacillus shoreicorticis]|uniref:Glycoside-pentoside-hexuronide (GPH):cation symporter n=1 Tax=Sporolactobacillus shoreicorticis TaxID=1923877 RepID=A0ABW5S247_9BACL|nr:MFS transporter [Sporolactobacillus shoreicorticis]MCO7127482.1 MFS transporter [Sporolactobacillus shoreicorticis]